MIHHFQAIYRTPSGRVESLEYFVDSSLRRADEAARAVVPGIDVVSVTRLGARIRDGQRWFTTEEAATYTGRDTRTIEAATERGRLRKGAPWSADELDDWMRSDAEMAARA